MRLGKHTPPPGRFIVVHVGIEGNAAVSESILTARLQTFADNLGHIDDKPLLNRAALGPDRLRIESAYAAQGYFQARVIGHRVQRFDDVSVRVFFQVVEGSPTRIQSVDLSGFELADNPAIAGNPAAERHLARVKARAPRLLKSGVGDVWTEDSHRWTKRALRRALVAEGFIFAEVWSQVLVSKKERKARVAFTVVPGPLVTCRSVRVTGNPTSDEDRILRRSHIAAGDIITAERLQHTEEDLAALRFFLSVSVRPARTSLEGTLDREPPTLENLRAIEWPRTAEVVITLQERRVHELKAGGGVELGGTRSVLYAITGYQNRNFIGGQRVLELTARPAWIVVPSFFEPDDHGFGIAVELDFTQPSFIEEYLKLEVATEYELSIETDHRAHAVEGSFNLSRPFLRRITPHLGYKLEYTRYLDVTGAQLLEQLGGTEGSVVHGYLEQGLTFDWRDNVLDPRRGVFASLVIREAHAVFGSDDDYIYTAADLRLYWTPWRYLTLALRLNWAQDFALQDRALPLQALIKGGGSTDFRGATAEKFGAKLCDDGTLTLDPECLDGSEPSVAGGGFKLFGSFEVRAYLPFDLGVVAFVDVGQIWDDVSDFRGADIDVAVGPGLRWYSPVGPVRMDLGFLLTAPNAPVIAFHLTLGQAF